jgi:hypothetical protein
VSKERRAQPVQVGVAADVYALWVKHPTTDPAPQRDRRHQGAQLRLRLRVALYYSRLRTGAPRLVDALVEQRIRETKDVGDRTGSERRPYELVEDR